MDNQIINCRCGRERKNKESNLSGLGVREQILIYVLCFVFVDKKKFNFTLSQIAIINR